MSAVIADAAADRDAGGALRWVAAFAFNLVLLVGAAVPVGLAAGWAVVALAGTEPGAAAETIVLAYGFFALPLLIVAAIYVGFLMGIACFVPEWGRRIAIAGAILVVMRGLLLTDELARAVIPFWCGLMTCMTVFAAWMHVDRDSPPAWMAWSAALVPAPLLIAAFILAGV